MREFVFRNLSVKLFPDPAANEGQVCECCSYVVHCDDCSLCTGGETDPCAPPTDPGCGASDDGGCGATDGGGCGATDGGGCGESDCGGSCGDSGPCFPCTDFGSIPCLEGTIECQFDSCGMDTGCLDTITIVVPPPDDAAAPLIAPRSVDVIERELALLRAELRAAMGRSRVEDPAWAAPASAVDDMARLRAALLDAVAQLDERSEGPGGGTPE